MGSDFSLRPPKEKMQGGAGGRRQSPFLNQCEVQMKPLPESQPPEDAPPELNWRRMKVSAGIKPAMILAGAPFCCKTHHPLKRTIPCFTRLPGCTLPCPFCEFPVRDTVWVPLINPAEKKLPRIVVQGGKRTYESLADKKPGDVVLLARGTGDRDTILFNAAPEASIQGWKLDKWREQIPFDFRPWLFHLWQWRELSENFGLKFRASIRTQEIEKRFRSIADDGPRKADV